MTEILADGKLYDLSTHKVLLDGKWEETSYMGDSLGTSRTHLCVTPLGNYFRLHEELKTVWKRGRFFPTKTGTRVEQEVWPISKETAAQLYFLETGRHPDFAKLEKA